MSHRSTIKLAVVVSVALLLLSGGVWVWVSRRALPPEFVARLASPVLRLNSLRRTVDGQSLIAGSAEGAVVVWDWNTRQPRVLEPSSTQPIVALAEADDGLLIATGLQGQLRGWQLPEFESIKLKSPEVPVTAIAFRHRVKERTLLFGLADGRIATSFGGQLTLRRSGHRGIKGLLLNKEQDVLVSVGTEGKLIWFDLKSSKPLATISAHRTEVSALLPNSDQTQFVTADWNGRLCGWDAALRTLVWEVQQSDAVSGLVWLGDRLVSGSWDGRLRVWSLKSIPPEVEVTIDTGRPILGLVVVSGDGLIATVSGSRDVEVWKVR